MIDIAKLKIGDKVHYQPSHYLESEYENGLVKEIPPNSLETVRVVYNCAGNWAEFQNYTSALTSRDNLKLGWRHSDSEVIDTKNLPPILEPQQE